MIAALTGQLTLKNPSLITLDVHGVGYEVSIPLSTFFSLPVVGMPLSLHIHTQLRENSLQLFGFLSHMEKKAFVLLTGISGVGGKLALSVLSTLSIQDLFDAIRSNDLETLASVPGIGKKSAGRISLELKEKVDRLQEEHQPTGALSSSTAQEHIQDDAISALVNLGYRAPDVKEIVKKKILELEEGIPLSDLIRECLKGLAKG
ncbi:MAG: Holliday junction branch migration protein RuvA [Nitrospirae bacterium]|nr:Holliday junction branch migration protein RuvA [Nitrospirota bacterium]